MTIVLERSGGFAGIRRTLRLDPPALDPAGEARLRAAIARAGFFGLPAELRPARARPDALAWRLEIADGARRHAVRWDEAAATGALRQLAELVEELAGRGDP